MSGQLVKINGETLPVREYSGKRVVTLKDVSLIHKAKESTLRSNFSNNRKHFIEGVDYFNLRGKKVVQNLDTHHKVTNINVFTESGYLMLVKSLTDGLSWQVQRELVNVYFKNQKTIPAPVSGDNAPVKLTENQQKELLFLMPVAIQELYRYRTYNRLTQAETAIIMNINISAVRYIEARFAEIGIDIPRNHKPRICNMWGA